MTCRPLRIVPRPLANLIEKPSMSRRGPDIRLSVMFGTTITSVKIPISHVLVILSLIELSPRATCLLVTVRTLKFQAPESGTWPPKPILFKADLQNGPFNLKPVGSTLVLPYYDVTIRYLVLLHLYRSYGCYSTLTDFDQIGDI